MNDGRWRRIGLALIAAGSVLTLVATLQSCAGRRTPLGHLIRFVNGEPGGVQEASDLAEDLSTAPGIDALQRWATALIARERRGDGRSTTSDNPRVARKGGRTIAMDDIPPAIRRLRHNGPQLQATIYPQRGFVALSWGLAGVYVGGPHFIEPPGEWYQRKLRPGVTVWFRER